jgi:hypothetical protein
MARFKVLGYNGAFLNKESRTIVSPTVILSERNEGSNPQAHIGAGPIDGPIDGPTLLLLPS